MVDSPEEKPQGNLYNKTTCIKFHQFLATILFAYGKVLDEFYDSQKNTAVVGFVPLAKQIQLCATTIPI
jgi:hypothetical protein